MAFGEMRVERVKRVKLSTNVEKMSKDKYAISGWKVFRCTRIPANCETRGPCKPQVSKGRKSLASFVGSELLFDVTNWMTR